MKVREILRILRNDGWYLVVTEGSHRQFKHPNKPGRRQFLVILAMNPKTLKSILTQAGLSKKEGAS
jgi:predicted RNA binding protein YcfA (HicA-like mRNA interferase family)